jgi:DNA-binding transcriptional MerR regulator
MTTISDLPDDPKYTIKTVAAKTGIQPVTLRAWERRYELLTPHRAENHYRLYSDRDIAILVWLKGRLAQGMSISSAVSDLRSMERSGLWPEAAPSIQHAAAPAREGISPHKVSARLYQALIQHEEAASLETLRQASLQFDLLTLCSEIITPALVNIGEAWYHGEIRIATEHFASGLVRAWLLALFQSFPSRRGAPLLMIGCAPTEFHKIGPLMLSVLLRSEGFRVEYLGANLPLEDLAEAAGYEQPGMVILSASLSSSGAELKRSRLCSKSSALRRCLAMAARHSISTRACENRSLGSTWAARCRQLSPRSSA